MNQDDRHLRLLSIFHYVVGGLCALFSCFFIMHLVFGLLFLTRPDLFDGPNPPPAFVGWMFTGIGSAGILMGWTIAVLLISAGRCLSKRRCYMFCFVVAAISRARPKASSAP